MKVLLFSNMATSPLKQWGIISKNITPQRLGRKAEQDTTEGDPRTHPID